MQLDELNVPELEKESDALPEDDGLPVADSLLEIIDEVPVFVVVVDDVIVTLSAPVFVVVVLAVMVRV